MNISRWTSSEEHREKFWNNFGLLRQLVASKAPPHNEGLQHFLREHPDRYVRQGLLSELPAVGCRRRAGRVRSGQGALHRSRDRESLVSTERTLATFVGCLGGSSMRLPTLLTLPPVAGGSTDADSLRSSYYDRAEYWAKQNPREYVDRKYDDFEEDSDNEKTDQRWPTLVTELRDLIMAATDRDTDPRMIDDAVIRLRNRVKALQDGHEARLGSLDTRLAEIQTTVKAIVAVVLIGIVGLLLSNWFGFLGGWFD